MSHKVYTTFLLVISIVFALSTTSCAFPKIFGFLDKDKNQAEESGATISAPTTYLDTINSGKEVALTETDLTSSVLSSSAQAGGKQTAGYRIQCFASTRIDAVRTKKSELEQQLQMPVYIVHAAPYYKMQVGDFISRENADAALKKVKSAGYNDAWVVGTTVFAD